MRRKTYVYMAGILLVSLAKTAFATPVDLLYADSLQLKYGTTISGNQVFQEPNAYTADIPTLIGVPGFDTSLGTLLSARLKINSYLATNVLDHAGAPTGTAIAEHQFLSETGLAPSPTLAGIIASSPQNYFNVNLKNRFSPVSLVDNAFINPRVSQQDHQSNQTHFDWIFTGAGLNAFKDTYLSYFHNPSRQYIDVRGYHYGPLLLDAINNFLALPTEIQPGTAPNVDANGKPIGLGDILSAAQLAVQIVNAIKLDQTGHGLFYSEMHIGVVSQVDMQVMYTYEPFANSVGEPGTGSVDEPGTLALFGFGLAGVFLRQRRYGKRCSVI